MATTQVHYLYPLNPKTGYLLAGKGKELSTSRENFFKLLDYRVLSEWGVAKSASAISKDDYIWVHFAAPDSAIYAVGRVVKTATWKPDWGKYAIKIRWDKSLTEKLQISPIPLSAHGQVPYAAVREANERTSRVLNSWLKGKVSSNLIKRSEKVRFRTAEVQQRVGQSEFRAALLRAYSNSCAVTGCTVDEVLQAAHIQPVAKSGSHSLKNGLLLRADIHNLFDLGLLTIDGNYLVMLDESIRKSKTYKSLHGQRLVVIPKISTEKPSKALLKDHRNLFVTE
jgi:hypothetical protein